MKIDLASMINRPESRIELVDHPAWGSARFLRLRIAVASQEEAEACRKAIGRTKTHLSSRTSSMTVLEPYSGKLLTELMGDLSAIRKIQSRVGTRYATIRQEVESRHDRFSRQAGESAARFRIDACRVNMANQMPQWDEEIQSRWAAENLVDDRFLVNLEGTEKSEAKQFWAIKSFFAPTETDYQILDRRLLLGDAWSDVVSLKKGTKPTRPIVTLFAESDDDRFWLVSKFGAVAANKSVARFQKKQPKGMIGVMWSDDHAVRLLRATPGFLGTLPDAVKDRVQQR